MKKYTAFTLAEILITLTILGVVAAMTIPGLMSNTSGKEAYTKTSRAYSTLANATKIAETENGRMRFWDWNAALKKYYAGKMNTARDCAYDTGCFPEDYKLRGLDGGDNNNYNDGNWYTFITTDGMFWAAQIKQDCSFTEGTYIKNGCAIFEVDTNGDRLPNRIGYDVFGFVVTPDGTYPFGGCPGCDTSACTSSSNGWACTSKLLNEGKLNW